MTLVSILDYKRRYQNMSIMDGIYIPWHVFFWINISWHVVIEMWTLMMCFKLHHMKCHIGLLFFPLDHVVLHICLLTNFVVLTKKKKKTNFVVKRTPTLWFFPIKEKTKFVVFAILILVIPVLIDLWYCYVFSEQDKESIYFIILF